MKKILIISFVLYASLGFTQQWNTIPPFTTAGFFGMSCISADSCFISDNDRYVNYTDDNGSTWTSRYTDVSSVLFLTNEIAIGREYPTSAPLRSVDGGLNWQPLGTGTAALQHFFFDGYRMAITHNDNDSARIYISHDNWETFRLYRKYPTQGLGKLRDSLHIYHLHSGTLKRSDDGGQTWATGGTITIPQLSDLYVKSVDTLFALGMNGQIQRSTDAGNTWTTVHNQPGLFIISARCIDNTCFAGCADGSGGRILTSLNGGQSWTASAPYPENITYVYFYDDTTGYIMGEGGTLLKYQTASSNPSGIWEQASSIPLRLYPNPTSDYIRVEVPGNLPAEISLFSLTGQQVYSGQLQTTLTEIPLNNLPKGAYQVRVTTSSGKISQQRVIIQ